MIRGGSSLPYFLKPTNPATFFGCVFEPAFWATGHTGTDYALSFKNCKSGILHPPLLTTCIPRVRFFQCAIGCTDRRYAIHIGTSGWTYSDWKHSFYPPTIPTSRWFQYYAQQFETVEINATFYRKFPLSTFLKWRTQAPPGFRYVLKAPRIITHRKYLVEVEKDIEEFMKLASLLEDTLGLILLQLAPSTPYDPPLLERALIAFPDPSRVAVEVRHPRWITEETKQMLANLGSVFCDSDSPKQRPLGWVTTHTAYLRLHGRSKWYAHRYTHEELLEILSWIRGSMRAGAREIYVFFNNDFQAFAPSNALELKGMIGEAFG